MMINVIMMDTRKATKMAMTSDSPPCVGSTAAWTQSHDHQSQMDWGVPRPPWSTRCRRRAGGGQRPGRRDQWSGQHSPWPGQGTAHPTQRRRRRSTPRWSPPEGTLGKQVSMSLFLRWCVSNCYIHLPMHFTLKLHFKYTTKPLEILILLVHYYFSLSSNGKNRGPHYH